MSRATLLGFSIVVVVAALVPARGQEPTVRERAKQAREVIAAMAGYPQNVREAVVIVSQDPKLAGRLFDAVKDKEGVTALLRKYPQDVQDAGQLLVKYPEVLDVMIAHSAVLNWAGEIYAKEGRAAVKKIADELRNDDEATERSVGDWAVRLRQNRVALHQLLEAISAFLEEQPAGEYADYGMGVSVDAKKVASIYALPPAPLAAFILIHADCYAEVADELVEQWLHTNSNSDFDQLMAHLWNANRLCFPDSILDPKGRPERIKELSKLAKKYGESLKEGETPLLDGRTKYLRANPAEFPLISQISPVNPSEVKPVKEGDSVPKPKVTRKSYAQFAANKPLPPPPPRPRIDKDPPQTAAQTALREVPNEVQRISPNEEQQARRGAYYFHWQVQAPTYVGPSPYFYGWNPYLNPAGGRVVTPAQYAYGRPWAGRPNFNRPVGRPGRR